ncbi:MAG TPA: nitroreductase/quinone reductase family protein [Thermomicrobiaceae bacterium]|nr:nitroreductase/quinone reductase family protein [Thermomicrobiaceae bacterium]
MADFDRTVIDAVGREREVQLTTHGRKTGRPSQRILWAVADGGRIYVRSGGGLGRDWPRNLLARGEGIFLVAGMDVAVRAQHVTDPTRARHISSLYQAKYQSGAQRSRDDEPLTPGEGATFELTPAGAGDGAAA